MAFREWSLVSNDATELPEYIVLLLCFEVVEDLIIRNELLTVLLVNPAQKLDTFWVLLNLVHMVIHKLYDLNAVTLPVVLIFKKRATNDVGWV